MAAVQETQMAGSPCAERGKTCMLPGCVLAVNMLALDMLALESSCG